MTTTHARDGQTPEQLGAALALRLPQATRSNARQLAPLIWSTATAIPNSGSEEKSDAA